MIELKHLTKTFGDRIAVSDLSFRAENGQVTGFVGPNGAGKSTTMRCIIGLDTPDSGEATIDGQGYADLAHPATRVGALLDPTWVHPARSARNHVRWVCRSAALPMERVEQVLDRVGLSEAAGQRVGRFSLGMRQRLALAVALIGEPDHLILDEPLNGLDPDGVRWVRGFIRDFAERGGVALVSSHLLGELSMVADSVVMIGHGALLGHDTVANLVSGSAAGVVVRIVEPTDALESVAAQHGWTVHEATDAVGGQPAAAGSVELRERHPDADRLTAEAVGPVLAAAGLTVLELRTRAGTLEEAVMGVTGHHVEYAAKENVS